MNWQWRYSYNEKLWISGLYRYDQMTSITQLTGFMSSDLFWLMLCDLVCKWRWPLYKKKPKIWVFVNHLNYIESLVVYVIIYSVLFLPKKKFTRIWKLCLITSFVLFREVSVSFKGVITSLQNIVLSLKLDDLFPKLLRHTKWFCSLQNTV